MAGSQPIHGHTVGRRRSQTHRAWTNMLSRCSNPRVTGYAFYGGRGISVDPIWYDFQRFLADMGEVPAGMTLERINNSGNYGPDNCRWATVKEQANNRRSSRIIAFDGQSLTLTQWAERTGIQVGTLHARLKQGWSIERALTEPVRIWPCR